MSSLSPFEALSRDQLISRLETEVWAAALPQISRHLADQVMALLGRNPQGVDLVMLVADSRHYFNAPALADWVGRQMAADPFFKKGSNQVAPALVLARQLSRLLERAEAANS